MTFVDVMRAVEWFLAFAVVFLCGWALGHDAGMDDAENLPAPSSEKPDPSR